MRVELERDLRDRVDLATAVEQEVAYTPPYLPPSVLSAALAGRTEEVETLLAGIYRAGLEVGEAEVILVAKKGGGRRPVTVVDFVSRVLYRALTNQVEESLASLDRSYERKTEAERQSLEDPTNSYVVVSDVSSFYDAIDHGRLVHEVVAQTGDAQVAEALAQTLHGTMGRQFGLPQVLHPSDVLSEAYIDIAERQLLRRGLDVSRYNDDFWIGAPNWPSAQSALEALTREIRDIGLSLNDYKTHPLGRDRYEEWLAAPEARWAELNAEVEIDLRTVGGYGEESEGEAAALPEQAEVIVEAATRALELALVDEPDRLRAEVNRQLLGQAVRTLDFLGAPAGLPQVPTILAREPHLTSRVSRYLTRVAGLPAADPDVIDFDPPPGVTAVLESVIQSPEIHLSEWQAMWLFEPLRAVPELSAALRDWVAGYLTEASGDLVRARAALTLGEKQLVEASVLRGVYGTVRPAVRSEIVWGIARALAPGDPLVRSVTRESPMARWVIEAARQ